MRLDPYPFETLAALALRANGSRLFRFDKLYDNLCIIKLESIYQPTNTNSYAYNKHCKFMLVKNNNIEKTFSQTIDRLRQFGSVCLQYETDMKYHEAILKKGRL